MLPEKVQHLDRLWRTLGYNWTHVGPSNGYVDAFSVMVETIREMLVSNKLQYAPIILAYLRRGPSIEQIVRIREGLGRNGSSREVKVLAALFGRLEDLYGSDLPHGVRTLVEKAKHLPADEAYAARFLKIRRDLHVENAARKFRSDCSHVLPAS